MNVFISCSISVFRSSVKKRLYKRGKRCYTYGQEVIEMDEESRAEIREIWKRERMRNWISILFVLAVIAGIPLLSMLACALWIAYLAYCYRRSENRGVRITNLVVMALPAGFFIWNLITLIRG